MIRQADKELLEELESLGEIIEWLENRTSPPDTPAQAFKIDEKELREWLKKPSLEQARSWVKKKRPASA